MKGVPKGFKWPSKAERAERETAIVEMREAGASYRDIGKAVGLSAHRVLTIYRRAIAISEQNA